MEKAYHGRTPGTTIQPICEASDKPSSKRPTDHIPEREWRCLCVLPRLEEPEPVFSIFSQMYALRWLGILYAESQRCLHSRIFGGHRGGLAQARVRDIAQLGAKLCIGMECRVLDIRSSIDVAHEAEPKGEPSKGHWIKAKLFSMLR